jgi:hypothetical protein
MKMRLMRRFSTLCVVLLICCAAVPGTTLERMPLERMAGLARVIVRARCVSNSTAWDAGEIWTFTSFDVAEAWKGSAPERVTVRLLGGTVGPLTSRVSGVPRFRAGEEVILFLEPTARRDFTVVSWQQGTFRVGRDPRSGAEIVTQDTAAFETFDAQTRQFKASGIRNLPLEAFRAQVQAAVAGQAGRKL